MKLRLGALAVTLAFTPLAAPLASEAQQPTRVPRTGYLAASADPSSPEGLRREKPSSVPGGPDARIPAAAPRPRIARRP
jgi:hypothetical protein